MQNITNEIIDQTIAGNEQAFELIYKAYFRFVSNVSYRIVNTKQEAEEVCQEVFITIYKKINTFRQESSLKTWIYRVTVNCALKYAQNKTKENKNMVAYDEENPIASPVKDVREKMDDQANEKLVEKLLNYLNLEQRMCIVLRSIEGLSYKQIADVLKIPINTVRSRIKRARQAMIAFRQEEVSYEL
ncbi:MAG: RNA polymerase sigma factor [Candidatus Omnitrophica bacterium]|nr:RNA polymerase sigma factor [Candidatus Omnitrophota bacterium]